MRKTIIALITMGAVTSTRAADFLTTLHFDPTLSREGNPFVVYLGLGVPSFAIVQIVLTGLMLAAVFLYWRIPGKQLSRGQVNNVWEFPSFCFYDRIMPMWRFLFCSGLPTDYRQTFRMLSFVCAWALVLCSIVVTFGWWARNEWQLAWYRQLQNIIAIGRYPLLGLIAGVFGCLGAMCVFFITEYSEANKNLHEIPEDMNS